MSVLAVAQVLVICATAGAAGLGALYLFGRYRPTAAQRAAMAGTSAAQRARARAVIADRHPESGHGEVDPVVAVVALDMLVRGREALNSITMALLCALWVFSASAWVLVALALAAAANLAVAVLMLIRRAGAKRFLAAHPEVEVPALAGGWLR